MVLRVLDDRDGRRAPGRAAVVIPRIQPVTERGSTRREKCAPGPAVGTSPELDVSGPGTAAPRPDFLVALACPRNRVILGMRRQDYLGQASRGWLWLSREGREAARRARPPPGGRGPRRLPRGDALLVTTPGPRPRGSRWRTWLTTSGNRAFHFPPEWTFHIPKIRVPLPRKSMFHCGRNTQIPRTFGRWSSDRGGERSYS